MEKISYKELPFFPSAKVYMTKINQKKAGFVDGVLSNLIDNKLRALNVIPIIWV